MKRASSRSSKPRRKAGAAKATIVAEGNVLRKAEPVEVPPQEGDRRRSQRHSESTPGWLSNATGGSLTSGRSVMICNLSLHGVGFTTHRPCQVGDRHWILITQGPMRLSTRVRIVSVQKREHLEEWNVGAEFF